MDWGYQVLVSIQGKRRLIDITSHHLKKQTNMYIHDKTNKVLQQELLELRQEINAKKTIAGNSTAAFNSP